MLKLAFVFTFFFSIHIHAQSTEGSSSMAMEEAAPFEKIKRATRSDYFYLPEARHSVVSLSYGKLSEHYDGDLVNPYGPDSLDHVRVNESVSQYNVDVKFNLNNNVFAGVSSSFRSSERKYRNASISDTYNNNDVSDYRGEMGYFSRQKKFNLLTSLSAVYIPSSGPIIRAGMAVIPQLGVESKFSGGVIGMKLQEEVIVQRAEHLDYGPRPSAVNRDGVFTGAAFYEFPAFNVLTVGATLGIQKMIGGIDYTGDTYFRKIYGSVNAINNTAVTMELQSSSSQTAHSESGFAVGIRQSL